MNYQIEIRHLIYFSVLAEELHFRKAAERLCISQPGLTRQIKHMEEVYQAILFERTKREVRLTDAGRYLKQEVDLILNQLAFVQTQIGKIAEGKIATLNLGFIGSAVQTVLPSILTNFKRCYPLADVVLHELTSESQLHQLLKNELDFGFVRINATPLGLRSFPLLTEPFSLVLKKGHSQNKAELTRLIDLKDEPFILFSKDYSPSYYELVMSIFSDQGFLPNVILKTVNALTIFQLVAQGLGVAIVPSSLKRGYLTDVDFIELINIPQRTTLYIVWNESSRNPGVESFLAVLKSVITGFD